MNGSSNGDAAAGAAATAAAGAPASAAEAFKEQGNAQFRAGQYLKAAALYTQALKADPGNAVLYSNRSAALLALSKTNKALSDAEQCIALRPDFNKGHFRKAAALEELGRTAEALHSYQAALECNRDSKQLAEKVRLLTKIVHKQQQQQQQQQATAAAAQQATATAAAH